MSMISDQSVSPVAKLAIHKETTQWCLAHPFELTASTKDTLNCEFSFHAHLIAEHRCQLRNLFYHTSHLGPPVRLVRISRHCTAATRYR